jgi:hypothetical protein
MSPGEQVPWIPASHGRNRAQSPPNSPRARKRTARSPRGESGPPKRRSAAGVRTVSPATTGVSAWRRAQAPAAALGARAAGPVRVVASPSPPP